MLSHVMSWITVYVHMTHGAIISTINRYLRLNQFDGCLPYIFLCVTDSKLKPNVGNIDFVIVVSAMQRSVSICF